MSSQRLLAVALLFPAVSTLLAVLLLLPQEHSLADALAAGMPFWTQTVWGLIAGLGVGALANAIEFNGQWFRDLREITREVFQRLRPSRTMLLLIAAGAGWGEEVLFRGAIQPVLGIWPTAILFALAHGLLTKVTWGRIAYTVILFFAGAGLGYLASWAGLWAAIVAHGVYDFVVLLWAHHLFLNSDHSSIPNE